MMESTNARAVFDVYFRKMPFDNGYAVFAGLEKVIHYLKNFRFTETDIAYLREELRYEEAFLAILKRSSVYRNPSFYAGR